MKCLMVRIWVTSVVYGYSNQQLYCMTYIGLRLLNQDNYYCPEWGLVPIYDDTRTNTISENIRKTASGHQFRSNRRIPHSHSINLDSVTGDKTSYPTSSHGQLRRIRMLETYFGQIAPTLEYQHQIGCNESVRHNKSFDLLPMRIART